MKRNFISLLIPFLAGLSTMIGYLLTYLPYSYHKKIIGYSLSFSAGIMITISIFSLIPEGISYINDLPFYYIFIIISIFIILGVFFSKTIDEVISIKNKDTKLYQIGIISMISLIIHNLPEGIITYLTTSNNIKLGITISLAIAIHNIPEGIAIAIPIYYATKNREKTVLLTALSGFSEFIGALLAYFFLKNYINNILLMSTLITTSGIMIDISLRELLPNSHQYISKKEILISYLLGTTLMLTCIFIFNI